MFIHKLADVQSEKIGKGTNVWQFVIILPKAIIGENCNICSSVFIENNVVIGNNVTIKNGVQIWDNITLDDDVFIGPNVTFTNDMYPKSKNYPQEYLSTIVNKGASIGANATIIGGISIGEYSMIGAGSVVTKSIIPYGLYYGNPAKLKGYITKNGVKLNLNLKDIKGNEYEMVENELILKK